MGSKQYRGNFSNKQKFEKKEKNLKTLS